MECKPLTIRRMLLSDLDSVDRIEHESFTIPWQKNNYVYELTSNPVARYLIAENDQNQIVGFAGAWIIIDESHVTNIAVDKAFRSQGIGHQLLESLLQYLSNLGASYTTLEVRESNQIAQRLYKSFGFQTVGKRKRYYTDNGEDAYIMVCDHLPEPQEDFVESETIYMPDLISDE